MLLEQLELLLLLQLLQLLQLGLCESGLLRQGPALSLPELRSLWQAVVHHMLSQLQVAAEPRGQLRQHDRRASCSVPAKGCLCCSIRLPEA